MRYKLYGKQLNFGSVLIYEGDNLDDVKRHYDDIMHDLSFISADIVDTARWIIVSYIDFTVLPRENGKVKKIGPKENGRR